MHRDGIMRLATALDEIDSVQDPRVRLNEAYLPVVLLSKVLIRLGGLPAVTPAIVERLFAADMAYLEDFYLRLNNPEKVTMGAVCPQCGSTFNLQVSPLEV
jgi:hypothetical protein